MACEAMHMWSFSGLVAAFLDLAIAYLLLCASAVAFLASKFLGFFGLNLPCPCDGVFLGLPAKEYCVNRLLIDFPTQKVSEIQVSVKRKFPFSDSVWGRGHSGRIVSENDYVNGFLEIEGEASCSSVSDPRNVVRRALGAREERYDLKGKRVLDHRPRSRLRQRRRGGSGRGNYSSVSSHDPSLHEGSLGEESHMDFGTDRGGRKLSLQLVDDVFDARDPEYDKNSTVNEMSRRYLTGVHMNHYPEDDDICMQTSITSVERLQDNQSFSGDEKDAVKILEKALEQEQAAHAAIYIELEKERSAAASAADEAMAMILRLQAEKASIEMEARQYQRILEEKSAYDAEEMNILKEILVRREREKHFLEKEVEAYRQMVSLGNEQLALGDGSNKTDDFRFFGLSLDPNDDPVLMLHQLTDKKIVAESKCSDGSVIECLDEKKPGLREKGDFYKESTQVSVCNGDGNMDLQEKEMVYTDKDLNSTPKDSQEKFSENIIPLERNEIGKEKNIYITCNTTEKGVPQFDPCLNDLISDTESRVYDVHVVDDQIDFCKEGNVSKTEQLSASCSSNVADEDSVPFEASVTKRVNVVSDCSSTSGLDTEADVKKTGSEINSGLPPIGPKGKSVLSDLRRSSMSSLDSEMLKIDCEVGRLRERLKSVQEGREKLSLSKEGQETENVQLKLLEDIARQVQEIRQLTEPGKAARQVSLPLPTAKVFSKKRRCKSVSAGLQRSSDG